MKSSLRTVTASETRSHLVPHHRALQMCCFFTTNAAGTSLVSKSSRAVCAGGIPWLGPGRHRHVQPLDGTCHGLRFSVTVALLFLRHRGTWDGSWRQLPLQDLLYRSWVCSAESCFSDQPNQFVYSSGVPPLHVHYL